jgi:hypothetical protein
MHAWSPRQLPVLRCREVLAAVGLRQPPDERQLLCSALLDGQVGLLPLRRSTASQPHVTSLHAQTPPVQSDQTKLITSQQR